MKLGIIGSGKIVKDFLTCANAITGLELGAIATTKRSAQVGRELAAKYGIKATFSDYRQMLMEASVDTVYVATPSSMHYQMSKDALAAGKNVICEKPFVLTAAEASELKQIADARGVMIVEAITNIYLPNFKALKADVQKLGPVHNAIFNYTQYSSRYDAFLRGEIAPAFDPKLGGGALLDLNVYNVHLAVALFGEPESLVYYPNLQKGVDTSGSLHLTYPDKQADLIAAKDADAGFRNQSIISGEKGAVAFTGSSGELAGYQFIPRGQTPVAKNLNLAPHRMIPEFTEFVRMEAERDFKASDQAFAHSLAVLRILEAARKFCL